MIPRSRNERNELFSGQVKHRLPEGEEIIHPADVQDWTATDTFFDVHRTDDANRPVYDTHTQE
jgi:hypothetical protein